MAAGGSSMATGACGGLPVAVATTPLGSGDGDSAPSFELPGNVAAPGLLTRFLGGSDISNFPPTVIVPYYIVATRPGGVTPEIHVVSLRRLAIERAPVGDRAEAERGGSTGDRAGVEGVSVSIGYRRPPKSSLPLG